MGLTWPPLVWSGSLGTSGAPGGIWHRFGGRGFERGARARMGRRRLLRPRRRRSFALTWDLGRGGRISGVPRWAMAKVSPLFPLRVRGRRFGGRRRAIVLFFLLRRLYCLCKYKDESVYFLKRYFVFHACRPTGRQQANPKLYKIFIQIVQHYKVCGFLLQLSK